MRSLSEIDDGLLRMMGVPSVILGPRQVTHCPMCSLPMWVHDEQMLRDHRRILTFEGEDVSEERHASVEVSYRQPTYNPDAVEFRVQAGEDTLYLTSQGAMTLLAVLSAKLDGARRQGLSL